MQIYTKILLGMFVGAVIGLTLGPTSTFLEHDLYPVKNASSVTIRLDVDQPESRLELPDVPLEFHVLERRTGTMTDSVGESHTVVEWVRVQFEFTRKLGLKDNGGTLRQKLGVKPDHKVTAWLEIRNKALNGGGFQAIPAPISGLGDTVIGCLRPFGALFMRLIKMVIVPLVFASLLVGVASLGDVRKLGRLGGKTLGLYLMTTAIAVTIGLTCAHIVSPGDFVSEADKARLGAQFDAAAGAKVDAAADAPSTVDNLLRIIPDNPIESLASGDMLQIIFFAVIFGIALTLLKGDEPKIVIRFFDRVQQAMVVVIHMVMTIAPYGVAALIAEVVGTSGFSILKALLVYALTVVAGLLIHTALVYGGLVRTLAKVSVPKFLRAARPAQLIAFSTSSSSATLPISMECAEENMGISNSVASFVLPLGSTVNMDGTALYQGVAAVFIAQVFGTELTFGAQLGIVGTATMASVGAAGVPGAGMVTLAMVLTASGIPVEGVALILGMDRLLDMFRTSVNVTGDLAVTAVMATTEGESIRFLDSDSDAADTSHGFEGRLDDNPEHPITPD